MEGLEFSLEDGLLTVVIDGADGTKDVLRLSLRSGKEGGAYAAAVTHRFSHLLHKRYCPVPVVAASGHLVGFHKSLQTESRRQREYQKHDHLFHQDGLAALLLFGIFAVCVLMVLLTGANAYRRLTERDQQAYQRRTCAQYLSIPDPADSVLPPHSRPHSRCVGNPCDCGGLRGIVLACGIPADKGCVFLGKTFWR